MGKNDVLDILKIHSNEIISGGQIASILGISRNAVWKNITKLKDEGYNIKSLNNRGYIFEDNTDYLVKREIDKNIQNTFFNIDIFDELDSTNSYLKRLPEEEKFEGKLVIANSQCKGRGRMGRSFESPENAGLYFSFVLKPKLPVNETYLLTILSAVALSESISQIYKIECDIKWVNDLFVKNKKICGILTEGIMTLENGTLDHCIVGIGINVNRNKNIKYNSDLDQIIGYLSDFSNENILSRNKLISIFLNKFYKMYNNFNKEELYKLYKSRMLYLNNEIIYKKGNNEKIGKLIDLNKDFSIQIEDSETKEILNCSTGEIRIRKL